MAQFVDNGCIVEVNGGFQRVFDNFEEAWDYLTSQPAEDCVREFTNDGNPADDELTRGNMTYEQYEQAERAACHMARGYQLFKRVEGTRYHSGKSDWRLFFRNKHDMLVVEIYNEPDGYSVVYGDQYSLE